MPITQDRLIAIVRAADKLATSMMQLKNYTETLHLPALVAQLNGVFAHTQDDVARSVIADSVSAIMSLHNVMRELQVSPTTLLLVAKELAHYHTNWKENTRQAAYQRRKRLGKDVTHQQRTPDADANYNADHPMALTKEMQDYLDGKINAVPPAPTAPTWTPTLPTPATPAPQPSWKPSWTPAGETGSERAPVTTPNAEAQDVPSSERAPDTTMLVPSKLPDGPREAPLAFDIRGKDVL